MNISDLKENKKHGTDGFPVAMYNSQWFIPYQWHNEDEFIYMVKGSAEYNINGRSIRLDAGQCAFCEGRKLHYMMLEEKQEISFRALVIDRSYLFPAEDVCSRYFSASKPPKSFYGGDTPAERAFIKRIADICDLMEKREYGYELNVKQQLIRVYSSIIEEWWYEEYEPITASFENIKRALEFIHINYMNKISADELAGLSGYSIPYFQRLFKEYTGKTPFEYLIMYRLNAAKKLLSNTDISLIEVASECGFSNVSYFIREFKKVFSVTPYRYRKMPE
ncbi:MAG: helix-turn-helix domain-containing protein [Oscillospiraceae bacterium]|nr:helix-turn-helix domain-containing protein [Oscillospiraceae bacterium]